MEIFKGMFLMKKKICIILVISFFLLISGCASLFKGISNRVSFNSDPKGAKVYVNGKYMGDTLIALKLRSKHNHNIEFRKEGYKTKEFIITNHIGAGWIILDVIGGGIPVIIDALTGAWYELDQKNVNFILKKQQLNKY